VPLLRASPVPRAHPSPHFAQLHPLSRSAHAVSHRQRPVPAFPAIQLAGDRSKPPRASPRGETLVPVPNFPYCALCSANFAFAGARPRRSAQKSVIPFLPSRLAERPLRRPVAGQSSHLARLHHRLHEEQERRRQEQQGSSFSLQQEIESVRSCSPVLPLEAPPAPPLSAPIPRVATGGDPDDGGGDSSSSHDTDFSADQESEGWVARPITRDAARGCHFHDALDTLLRRHLTGVLGLSSIVVWSSSTVAGSTRTAGRRPAWCAVQRTVSGVRRSAQSTIPSLSGTQLRRPCKMSHGVRFRTTAQCSVG
jgi:hypothetical protein